MPENEFEKQVQQKMSELSFVPSDAVWPEVERQIAERKKRRALFFWLPLAILLMAGAGWMFMHGEQKNEIAQQAASQTNDKTLPSNKIQPAAKRDMKDNVKENASDPAGKNQNSTVAKPSDRRESTSPVTGIKDNTVTSTADLRTATDKTSNNLNIKHSKTTYPNNKADRATLLNKSNDQTALSTTSAEHNKLARVKNKSAVLKKTAKVQTTAKQITSEPIVQEKQDVTEPPTEAAIVEATTMPGDMATNQANNLQQPPVADSASNKKQLNPDTLAAVATIKQPAKKAKTKLDWGIQIRGGFSNVSSGVSGVFSGSQSYDLSAYASNLSNSSPTSGSNGGSFNNGSSAPSDIRKGAAYSAGAFVRKPFGKNAGFSVGLNYSYFSNQLTVGAKIDSNKALVQYKPGQLSGYVNRFHFIEVPLLLEKKLGNVSRFSLSGGLAFSYLFASNALFYDAKNNVYAAGKDHINKLQVSLLAGASYRLWQKHLPVEIGPGFSYGLGNLFDQTSNGGRHLFYAGLTARMFLSK